MSKESVFPLTLHPSYYEKGFFNVVRAFDTMVRRNDGVVHLVLGQDEARIDARVDRRANLNGTARVMGGAVLRDWFQRHCQVMDTVYVDLCDPCLLQITAKDPRETAKD